MQMIEHLPGVIVITLKENHSECLGCTRKNNNLKQFFKKRFSERNTERIALARPRLSTPFDGPSTSEHLHATKYIPSKRACKKCHCVLLVWIYNRHATDGVGLFPPKRYFGFGSFSLTTAARFLPRAAVFSILPTLPVLPTAIHPSPLSPLLSSPRLGLRFSHRRGEKQEEEIGKKMGRLDEQ